MKSELGLSISLMSLKHPAQEMRVSKRTMRTLTLLKLWPHKITLMYCLQPHDSAARL
jgi:hypothetical protein